ncbi:hypothetical protein EVAR_17663_1 [Eumeta japonica]|uniref:Uncharacterized protein n=1 Tax=Eumeta variegata TaxID=151549 RepID=A0A4C1UT12_EUMVA|nr:hypothetical protein EVAR_17663_1 [Eumeta japonica]
MRRRSGGGLVVVDVACEPQGDAQNKLRTNMETMHVYNLHTHENEHSDNDFVAALRRYRSPCRVVIATHNDTGEVLSDRAEVVLHSVFDAAFPNLDAVHRIESGPAPPRPRRRTPADVRY